ncbi:MAG: response regulator [Syntrophobacteraceae bacterium]
MNILVLDTQKMHVESLSRGLMIKGHEVFSASDGKNALAHLLNKDLRIDLIITDQATMLPDGGDLVNHLEQSGRLPPVIMMTATNNPMGTLNPLEKLCGLFLEKPFSIEGLLDAVQACLQKRGSSHHCTTCNAGAHES